MSTAQVTAKKPQRDQRGAPHQQAQKPSGEEIIQTSFRLPRSRWARLQQLGIEERLSVQAIIITALEAEFERRGKTF